MLALFTAAATSPGAGASTLPPPPLHDFIETDFQTYCPLLALYVAWGFADAFIQSWAYWLLGHVGGSGGGGGGGGGGGEDIGEDDCAAAGPAGVGEGDSLSRFTGIFKGKNQPFLSLCLPCTKESSKACSAWAQPCRGPSTAPR